MGESATTISPPLPPASPPMQPGEYIKEVCTSSWKSINTPGEEDPVRTLVRECKSVKYNSGRRLEPEVEPNVLDSHYVPAVAAQNKRRAAQQYSTCEDLPTPVSCAASDCDS